jgi:hypothetical protein
MSSEKFTPENSEPATAWTRDMGYLARAAQRAGKVMHDLAY